MEFPSFKRSYGMVVAAAGLGLVLTCAPQPAIAQVVESADQPVSQAAKTGAKSAQNSALTSEKSAVASTAPIKAEAQDDKALSQQDNSATSGKPVTGVSKFDDKSQSGVKADSKTNTSEAQPSEKPVASEGQTGTQTEEKDSVDNKPTNPEANKETEQSDSSETGSASAKSEAEADEKDKAAATAAAPDNDVMAPDHVKNGWQGDTYYQDGKKANGWVVTNSFNGGGEKERYWFNDGKLFKGGLFEADKKSSWWAYSKDSGEVVRGKYSVGQNIYLADNDGRLWKPGWHVTSEFSGGTRERYYVDKDSHSAVKGYSSDGWKHYTKDDGTVARGVTKVGNKVYLADNDGKILVNPGWNVTSAFTGGTLERYWVGSDHAATVGLSNEGWRHYTKDDGTVARGVTKVGNKVYLANNDGKLLLNPGWNVTGVFSGGNLQRYWIGTDYAATVGLSNSGWAHFTLDDGSVSRGKTAYDGHILLSNNDGKLASGAGWLVTGKYDNDGLQRYWLEALSNAKGFFGAKTGFFKVSGSSYYGIANEGYVLRGKRTVSDHVLLADNDGKLANKAGWLVTSKYDNNGLERYWLEKVPGAGDYYGAKTGLFTLGDGTIHYGFSGVGYVERNARVWHGDNYYSANNDGLLTVINNWYAKSVKSYVNWMLGIAADDSHGYDQIWRWGEKGDYDCSSFVVTALDQAGVDVYGATYTGNMRSQLTRGRIRWYRDLSKIKRGDILLNEGHHTAVYLGDGMVVNASQNEHNGAVGGQPGDQTGREIWVRPYVNFPWDGFLRLIDE